MRKNRLAIILIILLAAVSALLILGRRSGTYSPAEMDFAVEDTATVTRIFLVDKNNRSVLLERVDTTQWRLNGKYKARQSGIDLILETLHGLKARAPVPISGHDNVVSQLAAQSVKVEIYRRVYRIDWFDRIRLFPHEKKTKTFYVGGGTQDNRGTFMLMEGADVPFVVHMLGLRGYVSPRFTTIEADWRDHTIFRTKISDIGSVEVVFLEEPDQSFKVVSSGFDFHLIGMKNRDTLDGYDTLRLFNFLSAFSNLQYEALINDMEPQRKDSIISTSGFHEISLTEKNGKKTSIKTFHKPNDLQRYDMEGKLYTYDLDRLYALINEGEDFVLIQFFVFDRVLRPLDFFRTGPRL